LAETLTVQNAGKLGATLVTTPEGKLAGILTDGDIRRQFSTGVPDLSMPIADLMTGNPRSGSADNSVAELLNLMEQAAITVLPVTGDDGVLLGVIHLHDLLGKGTVHFTV